MLNLLALGDGAKRDTNVTPASSDYTCIFRYRIKSTPSGGDYRTAFAFFNDPTYDQWAGIYSEVNNNDFRVLAATSLVGEIGSTFTIPLNTYVTICYRRSGSTHDFFINNNSIGSVTLDISGNSFNTIRIGSDDFSNDENTEVQYFKEWDVALTNDELTEEFGSLAPIKTSDLVSYLTLVTNANDSSGEGNNWTVLGSPTFITSLPTNTTAGTALSVGTLPASISQTVAFSGTTYEVWWRYTAVIGEKEVGAFGHGVIAGAYFPRTRVYSDAGVTQIVDTGTSFQNRAVQFPVTPANIYYLRFTSNSGNPSPATLLLEMETAPNEAVPEGSIAVNDDSVGFPLVVFSSVDGDDYNVLNFFDSGFPAGEAGDVLASGESLWSDAAGGTLKLYDRYFDIITSVSLNVGFEIPIRTNNGNNLFYIGIPGSPVTVKTVNDVGGIGATTYTLTGNNSIAGLASNLAGTILYFALKEATAVVKRWDLDTDTSLSDLVGATGAYRISDILVLNDDTIVVLYYNTVLGDFIVKRYDDAGTTLNTYSTTDTRFPSGTFPRLAYALDNPNSFWVMFHPDPEGIARFENWKVSDGSVLSSVDQIEYETGVYNHADTDTPLARFGVSYSCPFIITRSPVTPEPPDVPGTGLYEVITGNTPNSQGKTNDTLVDADGVSYDVAIPNPYIVTGFLVDK